ncbi:efflux RND transporter periplasmic adaptor subunit [Pseudoflavitalea sp. G-6-1-2]|uniref:efflux RND transporter periplasmic adaptor subunit n=1 Tax=Pseudoflavitalea sp. G-6-1-2 TaxID=2728841 RepID=UPI00146EEFC9|nr:efflux RND transporter periplasmic adaptor subunit [Pseudoflavitalea sp. G-6-1-2]NML20567.1 efflux RND transporter periplasmic adaptor subunit [Pseudoflavitalea sp. G-6-1-2]
MKRQIIGTERTLLGFLILCAMVVLASCGASTAGNEMTQAPAPEVNFIQATAANTTFESKYPGIIEGSINVDVRPQVTGYLEAIYVKEGDFVTKGQPLFKINDKLLSEQVNNAAAALKSAQAAQTKASIELENLKPLVQEKVESGVQLRTAQVSYDAATADVERARAELGTAKINAAFSLIQAPVSGYIGRIPNRIGNLVGPADAAPLTALSEINSVLVYFSMSEADYLEMMKSKSSNGIANTAELIMADGTRYAHKGTIEMASGNIDRTTGSIAMKAVFANPDKLLRSGGAARVVLTRSVSSAITIPMECVRDLQDKYFIYTLGDSNKVAMQLITVGGKKGNRFLVKEGVNAGDKIAITGTELLSDGAPVKPQMVADSTGL